MILPKISVVIPSLNKVNYIRETLDSIFLQKYPNLEVIIQDGGSTDGTLEIIHEFFKKYSKEIKLESKKDNGPLDATNKGFRKATGDILTYINADDAYELSAFNLVARAYEANPNALWFAGRGKVIDKNGNEVARAATLYKNILLSLNSKFYLLVANYLMQPSAFFTNFAFQKYGPFTGIKRSVMEYDFWLKLSAVSMPVVINKNLSAFRMSGENVSSLYFNETLKADDQIVHKYTKNTFILGLHKLHNNGRVFISRLI